MAFSERSGFLIQLLLKFNFSLWRLLLVQPDRLNDSGLSQRIQPFGKKDHSKGRPVRKTEKVERVLRIFPTRQDLFAVVIDPGRRKADDFRRRPSCNTVLRRNSPDHVLIRETFGPVPVIIDDHSKKLAVVKAEDDFSN